MKVHRKQCFQLSLLELKKFRQMTENHNTLFGWLKHDTYLMYKVDNTEEKATLLAGAPEKLMHWNGLLWCNALFFNASKIRVGKVNSQFQYFRWVWRSFLLLCSHQERFQSTFQGRKIVKGVDFLYIFNITLINWASYIETTRVLI